MKLRNRITLASAGPIILALGAVFGTLFIHYRYLARSVDATFRAQAFQEAAKVARNTYLLCASAESRNQIALNQSLGVAHDLLTKAGGVNLGSETVSWQAVNQVTKQTGTQTLPKMMLGDRWLGQVAGAKDSALLVDDVLRGTGSFCTIFQRMNEAGDMLRVATSVLTTDGSRAIGTYISARNPDGTENPVLQSVLRGTTYRGRAYVVNDWHAAAYEPLWDAAHTRVVGMIYVGVPLAVITKDLHDTILKMTVGKAGYVYVLGAQGDQRGRYIISPQGKRDGESIWEAKDDAGGTFIQNLIAKAVPTREGEAAFTEYPWKNEGDAAARNKLVAVTYFAPWDWVIGAGAYADDFDAVRGQIENAQNALLRWVALVAGAGALIAAVSGFLMARSISLPIDRVIAELRASSDQIADASQQVSVASSRLADGASDQAASLEETSASLEEMSSMTKRNAESATQANELAQLARRAADSGATDMQAMGQAMGQIKTASDDIAKIIKTIDEIAFQTNILALNAAVEAARAGEAGLGFAVVAEEVRNLAQRSAQAAKETAGKIEGAITKTAQGVEISEKVGASLAEIVGKVRGVDGLVSEVSHASREQSRGVDQISTAVGQMDKIVQSNAASAEESAAAAAELKAQAAALQDAVAGMVQLVGGQPGTVIAATGTGAAAATQSAGPRATGASQSGNPGPAAKLPTGAPSTPAAAGGPAESRDLIQWDEGRMSTGVASIDAQHRELIDMINRLHRACVEQRGQEELQEMMRFLSEYVQKHFRHEEDLMERHQCPGKAQNQAAHQKFLRDFTALTTAFNGGQTNAALLLDLRKLVGEWLVSHICRVDTQLRQCSRKPGGPGAGGRMPAPGSSNGHAELSFTDIK